MFLNRTGAADDRLLQLLAQTVAFGPVFSEGSPVPSRTGPWVEPYAWCDRAHP